MSPCIEWTEAIKPQRFVRPVGKRQQAPLRSVAFGRNGYESERPDVMRLPDEERRQSVTGKCFARASMKRRYGFRELVIVEPVLYRHDGEQIGTFE
jgi:hypothetical protein